MNVKSLFLSTLIILNCRINAQNDSIEKNDSLQKNKTVTNRKKPIENKFQYKKSTGINVLYAMPIGHFAKKEGDGGFAMPGWGVSFDTRNHIGYGFSFLSYSSYSWINLDGRALADELTKATGLNTTIIDGQHRPFFSTIGLSKHFYLTPRLQMGLSATAGILYTSFKALQITMRDNTNQIVYNDFLRFDSDFAFAYGFSTDFNLFIIKNVLALHFEVKYNTAKTDSYLRSNYFDPIKTYERMEFLNLNMGLNFYSK